MFISICYIVQSKKLLIFLYAYVVKFDYVHLFCCSFFDDSDSTANLVALDGSQASRVFFFSMSTLISLLDIEVVSFLGPSLGLPDGHKTLGSP
jgi:hypothetical protein